ncbi:putative methylated-DNA--protein-cysteine methyltransferase [Clavispora lusitaniae]|uniref:Methylated-DNA--protein-cysteine methyltransferase n=1 Tax=Clavispora lusitaniae TaxID=36911 RepID=A0AA91PZW6_CLALS|nr:putative methylated-DNA--protein-cysteine methyltransferase [Clavispora lusitaniae]
MKVYYWYVGSELFEGLAGCDPDGTLVYLSLGQWQFLVDVVKRDFIPVKRNHELLAGHPDKQSDGTKETLALLSEILGNPANIDRIGRKIRLRYIFGTSFQRKVWDTLMTIKMGETLTYSEVAARAGGKKGASRAAGHACGANRIALLVPCHRVVSSAGALTGYRWGIDVKRQLLDTERQAAKRGL